jgi:hypothetical protein
MALVILWMHCLALQPGQKLGMMLPFEVVSKLKLPKIILTKDVLPKSYSSMKKKFRKIRMIF